jgi:hypothetical protein
MSAKCTNQHHPQLRRRVTGVSAILGGALAAAFLSTGTALAVTDADAFDDIGLPGGSLLDALTPTLSQQLDSVADQIGSIITPDNDAYFDLVQAFDPNAATDSLGMFATDLDTLLTPFGFEPALDAATDNLLSLFGLTAM